MTAAARRSAAPARWLLPYIPLIVLHGFLHTREQSERARREVDVFLVPQHGTQVQREAMRRLSSELRRRPDGERFRVRFGGGWLDAAHDSDQRRFALEYDRPARRFRYFQGSLSSASGLVSEEAVHATAAARGAVADLRESGGEDFVPAASKL